MSKLKKILLVAAENDALPGAKVGGVGDVIRDLPIALTKEGLAVNTVIPSYGFLSRLPNLEVVGEVAVSFGGKIQSVMVFRKAIENADGYHYIFHSPAFSVFGESVYWNDDDQPFASDATKFALFSIAVLQALKEELIPWPDVLHCHDWHAAFIFILIEYSPLYRRFRDMHTVFTVHNLAMQGVRPFKGDESSLEMWYPELKYDGRLICDPSSPHCVNPMRAAVEFADKVHTVSPTYAIEIQSKSQHRLGVYGGEGLENELKFRYHNNDLVGVLNGCEYPTLKKTEKTSATKKVLHTEALACLEKWVSRTPTVKSAHWLAERRLNRWLAKKHAGFTLTSIGRVTQQKVRLLETRLENNQTVLEALLDKLGDQGFYFLLGSGDPQLEQFFTEVSGDYENFIFLNGYSDRLSQMLYQYGQLFLMPSSFEPCGISQMLAMRSGQPCLVNAVGGLKDTVFHGKNGFVFEGGDIQSQAKSLLTTFAQTLQLHEDNSDEWQRLSLAAEKTRYTWQESARDYKQKLYSI